MCSPFDLDTDPAVIDRLFAAQAATALALRRSSVAERKAKLVRLREALLARREAFLTAFQKDLGKPAVEVDLTELVPVADEIRHALSHLKAWMRPHRAWPTLLTLGTRASIVYQPRGRSLIIGPWNYPLNCLVGPLVSAVAAGNTVILKPSEFTPHVNAVIAEMVAAVFRPEEVALVPGAVATATHLLAQPFEHIFFTGSPGVGKLVMAAAARHLAAVTLELGGKSPVIVDASANLRHAAEHILWGKFVNGGQTCVAPDHVHVHRSVHDAFVAECRKLVAERFGADAAAQAASPNLARMIHSRHAQRLADMVGEATAHGAQVVTGGGADAAARYIAPTLLTGVPDDARLTLEEIFGPVLPIAAFDDLGRVIDRINAAPKPLALYLWARDGAVAERVRTETSSGSFCVNLCMQQYAHTNLPFGGVNNSGLGNAHGFYGFRAFSHERATLRAGTLSVLKLLFPPYTPRVQGLSKLLLGLLAKF